MLKVRILNIHQIVKRPSQMEKHDSLIRSYVGRWGDKETKEFGEAFWYSWSQRNVIHKLFCIPCRWRRSQPPACPYCLSQPQSSCFLLPSSDRWAAWRNGLWPIHQKQSSLSCLNTKSLIRWQSKESSWKRGRKIMPVWLAEWRLGWAVIQSPTGKQECV